MPSTAAARRFARGARTGAPRPSRLSGGSGGRLHFAATLFLMFSLFAPVVSLQSLTAAAAPELVTPTVPITFPEAALGDASDTMMAHPLALQLPRYAGRR